MRNTYLKIWANGCNRMDFLATVDIVKPSSLEQVTPKLRPWMHRQMNTQSINSRNYLFREPQCFPPLLSCLSPLPMGYELARHSHFLASCVRTWNSRVIEWKKRENNQTNSKSQYTPNTTNIPNMDRQHKFEVTWSKAQD